MWCEIGGIHAMLGFLHVCWLFGNDECFMNALVLLRWGDTIRCIIVDKVMLVICCVMLDVECSCILRCCESSYLYDFCFVAYLHYNESMKETMLDNLVEVIYLS